jgi:hypothetical protein
VPPTSGSLASPLGQPQRIDELSRATRLAFDG